MDVNTMIYNILRDLITLIATVGLGYLTMFAKSFAKSHLSAKQLENAQAISDMAVQFAQQIGLPNNDKYLAALEQAKSFAKQHGINYTDEQWRGLIESSVIMAKKDWTDVTTENVQPQQTVEPTIPVDQVQAEIIPVTPIVEPIQPVQEQPTPVEATPTQQQ